MATGPKGTRQKVQMQMHAQRRGTGLEVEREQFERNQFISITKAINSVEAPVKEKHVRSAIIGTFKAQGSQTFWTVVVTSLSLQSHPILCWKFCHTLHKLLREGHANVIPESQKFRNRIYEFGEFWNHLRAGYGHLNKCYCRLLVCKLDFHEKNPRFPGNLQLAPDVLENIGERDVNNYFQLTVEMFDYMDEILALYTAIYNSLDMSRSNSMTTTGQCRLAPLIPCIQDSSQLYDYSVKILFKLHSSLPPDILLGHRDRFLKQFKTLKEFYKQTSTMQYFKNLIQIPQLPDQPPNFLRVSDLSFHISPVVVLPPRPDTPESDSSSALDVPVSDHVENLVDLDTNGSASPDHLAEKDMLIECLQREIADLHRELNRIKMEDQRIIDELRHQLMTLDGQMAEMQLNVIAYTKENTELQRKLREGAVHVGAAERLDEVERRAKSNEDKLTKMRVLYNKLRDEHIALLRNKAEIEKQFTVAKKSAQESQRVKEEMAEELLKAQNEKSILEVSMQQSENASKEELLDVSRANVALEETKRGLEEKIHSLSAYNEELMEKLQKAQSDRSVIEEVMQQSSSESMRQLAMVSQAKEDLERAKQTLEDKINLANSQNQELEEKLRKIETDKATVEDELKSTMTRATQQLTVANQIKEELERTRQTYDEKVVSLNTQNEALDSQVSALKELASKLEIDVQEIKQESQDSLQKAGQESIDRQRQLLESCVRKAEEIINAAIASADDPATSAITCPPEHLQSLIEPLLTVIDKTVVSHKSFVKSPEDAHVLLENIMMFSHMMAHIIVQGRATSNSTPDIDRGDKLLMACKLAGTHSLQMLPKINSSDVENEALVVKHDVDAVNKLASSLADAAAQNTAEQVGELVEDEMQQMDRAIEEAAKRIAELLNNSRQADHGVKLEVNAKVLDSCTGLMKAIRVLVQRSRDLQNEIVAQGKGSASVKEFYKRNHRWTEGFISAAKSVGLGARFLVDAADKVVKGDGKFEVLMVASQEIAASTAQLVVASKVKADRTSGNLTNLSLASKQVTEATGNVVATAKSCAQLLEDSEVLDFSKLSLHQAKRLEMECQVHVLELENNLGKERVRLAALRKQHYTMAGPSEGWELEDIPK